VISHGLGTRKCTIGKYKENAITQLGGNEQKGEEQTTHKTRRGLSLRVTKLFEKVKAQIWGPLKSQQIKGPVYIITVKLVRKKILNQGRRSIKCQFRSEKGAAGGRKKKSKSRKERWGN